MKNFARLLSVFLCVFLTGCKEPTMTEKEKSIADYFLKNENGGADKLVSWIMKDATTFEYDFPHLRKEGIIQITKSDDKLIRQYDICYTLDERKLYGRNVVQYRTDKGIQAFIGSLRSLKYLNSEYNCDCDGISIYTIPRKNAPLYLLTALETEHQPYSYATITGIEIKNDSLVYVEGIFPNNDVSFEFDASCLKEKDFKYLFNYIETDNTLYIQKKDEFNQLVDSFMCYQWNGEKFIIVNP